MGFQFIQENFETICDRWSNLQSNSADNHIFSTLEWSRVWWNNLNTSSNLFLASILRDNTPIGIVPFRIDGDTARFIGSANVCDYLDFIVAHCEEDDFYSALIEKLSEHRIKELVLFPVRQDSTVITSLLDIAERQKLKTEVQKEDVSLYLDLPATWDDYLRSIASKQRHELRRKLRRLGEIGNVDFHSITNPSQQEIDIFFKFFRESREDKSAFLTNTMESFFRELISAMIQMNYLKLNLLKLNDIPIAVTICFDYKDVVYLYNSGYNPDYNWLSAGLISKALTIQDSINKNKRRFDFLKGNEEYKHHLGGQILQLYQCSIRLPE